MNFVYFVSLVFMNFYIIFFLGYIVWCQYALFKYVNLKREDKVQGFINIMFL